MDTDAPSFAQRCQELLQERPDLFVEEQVQPPQTVQTGWWWAAPHREARVALRRRHSRTRVRQLNLRMVADRDSVSITTGGSASRARRTTPQ
jgi:hypothetical protein